MYVPEFNGLMCRYFNKINKGEDELPFPIKVVYHHQKDIVHIDQIMIKRAPVTSARARLWVYSKGDIVISWYCGPKMGTAPVILKRDLRGIYLEVETLKSTNLRDLGV